MLTKCSYVHHSMIRACILSFNTCHEWKDNASRTRQRKYLTYESTDLWNTKTNENICLKMKIRIEYNTTILFFIQKMLPSVCLESSNIRTTFSEFELLVSKNEWFTLFNPFSLWNKSCYSYEAELM